MIDTAYFKKKLQVRKAELEGMMAEIEDRLDDPKTQDDSDRAQEREDDEVMEIQGNIELQELQAIDSALARIDNGIFGTCLSCENEISRERLEAVPHATVCRFCMRD